MTEYDYSPEAYERYMCTQERIARWVDQTEEHRPEFGMDTPNIPPAPPRASHANQRHTIHGHPHRRTRSFSSSSFSSSSPSSSSDSSLPGPMPTTFPPMYSQQPVNNPKRSRSRRRSSRHRSHRLSGPIYGMSPPGVSPPQHAPYSMNTHVVSPGGYGFPTNLHIGGSTTIPSPPYYQPHTNVPGYYAAAPNTYTVPQNAYPQPQPQTAPPNLYTIYGPKGQLPVQTQSQAQYPHTSYPPMIYPLTLANVSQPPHSAPQSHNQKPLFYQRIFGGTGDRKSKRKNSRNR